MTQTELEIKVTTLEARTQISTQVIKDLLEQIEVLGEEVHMLKVDMHKVCENLGLEK